MDKLYLWEGKYVALEDEDGKVWRGRVVVYEDEEDSEYGEEAIALAIPEEPDCYIEFKAHEIKSIREIDPPKRR